MNFVLVEARVGHITSWFFQTYLVLSDLYRSSPLYDEAAQANIRYLLQR